MATAKTAPRMSQTPRVVRSWALRAFNAGSRLTVSLAIGKVPSHGRTLRAEQAGVETRRRRFGRRAASHDAPVRAGVGRGASPAREFAGKRGRRAPTLRGRRRGLPAG